jgi:hypothetical protein
VNVVDDDTSDASDTSALVTNTSTDVLALCEEPSDGTYARTVTFSVSAAADDAAFVTVPRSTVTSDALTELALIAADQDPWLDVTLPDDGSIDSISASRSTPLDATLTATSALVIVPSGIVTSANTHTHAPGGPASSADMDPSVRVDTTTDGLSIVTLAPDAGVELYDL